MIFQCELLTIHGISMRFNDKKKYFKFVETFIDHFDKHRSGYDDWDDYYRAFLVGDCATDIFLDVMQKTDIFQMFRIGSGGKDRIIIGLTDKWNTVIRVNGRFANGVPKTFCDKMLFDKGKAEVKFYQGNKEIGKCTWEEFSDVEIRVLD